MNDAQVAVQEPHNKRMNLTVRPVTRLAGLDLTAGSTGRAQGARPSGPQVMRGVMRTNGIA